MCAFSSDAGQGSPLEWRFSSALREFATEAPSSVQTGTRRRQGAVSSQRQSLRGRASRTEGDRRDEEKNREQEQDRKARARVSGSAVYMPFSVSVNSRVEALFSRLPLTVWLCPVKQGVGRREACQPSIHGLSLVSAVGND